MGVVFVAQIGAGARAVVCSIDCVHEISSRLRDDEQVPPTWDELEFRFTFATAHTASTADPFSSRLYLLTFAPSTTIRVQQLMDTGLNAREFATAFVALTDCAEIQKVCGCDVRTSAGGTRASTASSSPRWSPI